MLKSEPVFTRLVLFNLWLNNPTATLETLYPHASGRVYMTTNSTDPSWYAYEVQSLNPVMLHRLFFNKVFESDYNRVRFLLSDGSFFVTDTPNVES
jgi:hypothetical protein